MNLNNFLDKKNKFAVVGVSLDSNKWGWKIYNKLKSIGYHIYPINPKYKKIRGNTCYPNLKALPHKIDVIITVVPPNITKQILIQCKKLGINKVWMQPGSESEQCLVYCKKNKIHIIYNTCFVVNGLKRRF